MVWPVIQRASADVRNATAPAISSGSAEEILRVLHDAEMARQVMPPSQWLEDHRYVMEDTRAAVKWAFSKNGDAHLGEKIATVLMPLARAIDSTGAFAIWICSHQTQKIH